MKRPRIVEPRIVKLDPLEIICSSCGAVSEHFRAGPRPQPPGWTYRGDDIVCPSCADLSDTERDAKREMLYWMSVAAKALMAKEGARTERDEWRDLARRFGAIVEAYDNLADASSSDDDGWYREAKDRLEWARDCVSRDDLAHAAAPDDDGGDR